MSIKYLVQYFVFLVLGFYHSHSDPIICENGGHAVDDKCVCPDGFGGEDCGLETCKEGAEKCRYGSQCVIDKGVPTCICSKYFSGETCDIFIGVGQYCTNGEQKYDEATKGISCECPLGFNGDRCENFKCTSDKHCNRGTCSISTGVCECEPGYGGPNCKKPDCITFRSCGKNQVCKIFRGKPKCSCANGWTGTSCKTRTCHPDSNPCVRGSCYPRKVGGFNCVCPAGFGGRTCAHQGCEASHCHNNGDCYWEYGTRRCDCNPGFYGPNCEYSGDISD